MVPSRPASKLLRVLRLRETLCPKHGARVALGVDMGASPHPPFPLLSSRGGVPLLAV